MGAFELDTITCMDALALMDGLPAQSVDAIITDMPYGVTACAWDTIVPFAEWWPRVRHVLKPRGVFVTTATEPFASLLRVSNLDWYRYDWKWNKGNATGHLDANQKPLRQIEPICIFYAQQPIYNPQMVKRNKPEMLNAAGRRKNIGGGGNHVYGDHLHLEPRLSLARYPTNYLKFSFGNKADLLHPTQKPVALYEYLIKTYTNPGAIVLDPFCGSGTTAIAACNTGRHFICGDISPDYVAIARKRLQDTDPFQPTQIDDNHTQLSLFAQEDEA